MADGTDADPLTLILEDCQKLLQNLNIRENATVSTMSRLGKSSLVEKFLMESISMRPSGKLQSSEDRNELLHNHIYTCSFWGYRDIIKRIIDFARSKNVAIDINRKNKNTHWTPLHAAAFQEHGPVIMLLFENGADPQARDLDGWTPIHFASVSDKVWGHFAAHGLQRISTNSLMEAGMICRLPESPSRSNSAKVPGQGIRLVDYSGLEIKPDNDSSLIGAALAGDVLASSQKQLSQPNTTQRPLSQRPTSYRQISQIPFN